jgi:hypothetical protein
MITTLAMEKEFQFHQLSQMLEHSRPGEEELRLLFHQIPAAQETDAGLFRPGACRLAVSYPRPGQAPLRRNTCEGPAGAGDVRSE